MSPHSLAFCAVATCLALAISGCDSSRPRYTIYMVNMTHRDLDGVSVYFGGRMAATAGELVKGGKATYGFVTLPIPAEAEVRWASQGAPHAPKVKLDGIVPKNPRDVNIYFIIREDESVRVKVILSADLDANVEAIKGIEKYRDKTL